MTGESANSDNDFTVHGSLWLTVGGANLGGHGRMALLRAIAEHGSITRAAKAFGMSYKAAWDAVDTMNNVAGEPLVVRSTGGRGGGATTLTTRGAQLVERFAQLDALHQRFVRMLDAESIDLSHDIFSRDINLLRMLDMKTSARNQFVGTVTAVTRGAVNDEVTLALPGGTCISAIITHESTTTLGLQPGITAFALVKASSVIVAIGEDDVRLSARNRLRGTITAITPGAVNAEVVITPDGSINIAAIVTQASVTELGLRPGMTATAVFKASSVIVGVSA